MIVSCFSLLAYHVWENTQSTRLLQLNRHFSQWVFPVPLQPIPLRQSQSGHRNEGFQTETKTFTIIWSHSDSLTGSCCIIFHFWWTIANYSPFSTKSPLYWHVQLLIHTLEPTKTWRVNCRLRESNCRRTCMRRSPDTSTFRREFTACNFLGCNLCKSTLMLFPKVLFILWVAWYIQRTQRSGRPLYQVVA